MPMLTTALAYNGEDRLVLMGTTLWEQGLSGKSVVNTERFALAVFPGAWNQARAPRARNSPLCPTVPKRGTMSVLGAYL